MEGKVLLAFDGSESSVRAAKFAAKFMKMFPGTRVTTITVPMCSLELSPVVQSSDALEEISQARIREAEVVNKKSQEIFAQEGESAKGVVRQGFADRIISDYAALGRYEQIIIGTRGLVGVQGFLKGSISRKVISQVTCPVTLVK